MNLQDVIPFGPKNQSATMSDHEPALRTLANCSSPSTPHSQNSVQYCSDSDGRLVVTLTVLGDHVVSVELYDVLSFDPTWRLRFLGWLMPRRIGHNLALEEELRLRAEDLVRSEDNLNGLTQSKCCWLAGSSENCCEHGGEVVFEFSRIGSSAIVVIKATHRPSMV